LSSSIEVMPMNASDARAITDRMKTGVSVMSELIKEAYQGRVWDALGYSNWDEYVTREFGTGQLRIPKEERTEYVASLRDSGMSLRAIASATGISEPTVRRELANATASFDAVDQDGIKSDLLAEELIATASPVIIGTNGSRYTPPTPKPAPKPVWSEEELALRKKMQNGETVVVSLRGLHANLIAWAETEGLYVRIDRRTDWGNPFEMPDDGGRDEVIAKYRTYYLPHKVLLQARLPELAGKALGCWCSPEACHGDVLKGAVEDL
jgi:hypothetical protein